jgi:hypothetical protein
MKIGYYASDLNLVRRVHKTIDEPSGQYIHDYTGGNTGNFAFHFALLNQFAGPKQIFGLHHKPELINKAVDILVYTAANQLGSHTNLKWHAELIKKLEIPFIVIGLGAQADSFENNIELQDGTREWLEAILENGKRFGIKNIWTRGTYTTQQIKRITGDETVIGGCPSYFINWNHNLGISIENKFKRDNELGYSKLAIAAGNFHQGFTKGIERNLVKAMENSDGGEYIVQHPIEMIQLAVEEIDKIPQNYQKAIQRYLFEEPKADKDFKLWAKKYARLYCDVVSWMETLSHHSLTVGMRYHGVALAIQSGSMGCVLTIDSRTQEMCEETSVPFIKIQELEGDWTIDTIKEKINFDGKEYDKHRKARCIRYKSFIESVGLRPTKFIKEFGNIDG